MTVGETEQAAPLEAAGWPLGIGLVSVIVPHLDDYDNLDACLKLLEAQSFPGDRTEPVAVARCAGRAGQHTVLAEATRRQLRHRGR